MPPVSFIIPAFNCQETLAASVASIVDGNLTEGDEIVVADDGSTDNTRALLADLTATNRSLRFFAHRHNRGGGAARNTAVQNARHDLIFCLDSDNLLVPGSVAKLRDYLLAEKADAASFREIRFFKRDPDDSTHHWRYRPGVFSLADQLAGHYGPPASGNYLYTRASWVRAGGYPDVMLDTWGFAFRQLATGQRMVIMPDGHYRHRHGHESYWVRESKDPARVSLMALQLVIPFLHLLDPSDADYIMSGAGRHTWFWELERRPLRLASGERGTDGALVKKPETKMRRLLRNPRSLLQLLKGR